jgi:hypothetical protein
LGRQERRPQNAEFTMKLDRSEAKLFRATTICCGVILLACGLVIKTPLNVVDLLVGTVALIFAFTKLKPPRRRRHRLSSLNG